MHYEMYICRELAWPRRGVGVASVLSDAARENQTFAGPCGTVGLMVRGWVADDVLAPAEKGWKRTWKSARCVVTRVE